jgi:PadR family transcriptional regulator, regulatory protein PadR
MEKRINPPFSGEMLQGTLDLLILKTLALGPAHGQAVATIIERNSDSFLQVEHGSLYPALYRLQERGWIVSHWGTTENNRKAKYYKLTAQGRKQLAQQISSWDSLVRAMERILHPAKGLQE